jgi:cytoskeletal protein CcmA (bactofilin family)
MPASKQDKIPVPCPHCGHSQAVPRAAFSTICQKCAQHFLVQEVIAPARKPKASPAPPVPERRRISCFDCGAELEVVISAESTMCKRCSRHIDLRDYHIANAVSKNFKTKGAFVVEPKGYVFNSEAIVGDAVIKGRFLGKLSAERTLTIYSTADIRGSFTARLLIIPIENHFHWKEPLRVGGAEIAGELVADLVAAHTITLKTTALLFGNIEAANLVVQPGAVVVGQMRIGSKSL